MDAIWPVLHGAACFAILCYGAATALHAPRTPDILTAFATIALCLCTARYCRTLMVATARAPTLLYAHATFSACLVFAWSWHTNDAVWAPAAAAALCALFWHGTALIPSLKRAHAQVRADTASALAFHALLDTYKTIIIVAYPLMIGLHHHGALHGALLGAFTGLGVLAIVVIDLASSADAWVRERNAAAKKDD